jgi:hypothetical protein
VQPHIRRRSLFSNILLSEDREFKVRAVRVPMTEPPQTVRGFVSFSVAERFFKNGDERQGGYERFSK